MTSFHMPDDYVRKFPRTRMASNAQSWNQRSFALNKQLSHRTKTATHSRFWLAALQVDLSTVYLQHMEAQSVIDRFGQGMWPRGSDHGWQELQHSGHDDVHVNMLTFLKR